MKRTIISLLALLSLSVMVPAAYAQEYIPEVSTLRGADIMRKTHLSRFLPQTSYQGLP